MVAGTESSSSARRFNRCESRGDDLLFVGIVLLAAAVAAMAVVACHGIAPAAALVARQRLPLIVRLLAALLGVVLVLGSCVTTIGTKDLVCATTYGQVDRP